MKTAGICFLICGGVLLLLSGLYFGAYLIFEKMPHKAGRALGSLRRRKYKKDVAVWEGMGKFDGPPRVAFTIKHLTKSKYIYRVNNKLYFCVFDFWRKPGKVPKNAWVTYLKAFPRISYLENEENHFGAFAFLIKATGLLGIAVFAIGLGVKFLFMT